MEARSVVDNCHTGEMDLRTVVGYLIVVVGRCCWFAMTPVRGWLLPFLETMKMMMIASPEVMDSWSLGRS